MTPSSLRAAFSILESQPGKRLEVRALPLDSNPTAWGSAQVAVDSAGHRHVLVPVAPESEIASDDKSVGIHLGPYTLEADGTRMRFLDLACRRPDLFDVFSTIATEVVEAIGPNNAGPSGVAIGVLERWRALLARAPSTTPSTEVLVGLWGELFHLREVCRIDPLGVPAWRGPRGAVHDFRVANDAFEVKATLVRGGWRASISGLDQLETPTPGSLHFGILRLEELPGGGLSVPALIDEIVALGADAALLHDLVSRAGLGTEQLVAAREWGFRLLDHRVWHVDEAFPRMTRTSFVGGAPPPGVARIEYQLDLSAHAGHAISDSAVRGLHARLAEARG